MKFRHLIMIFMIMLLTGINQQPISQDTGGGSEVQVKEFNRNTWQKLKEENSYEPSNRKKTQTQTASEGKNGRLLDSPVIRDVIKYAAITFLIIAIVYVVIRISGVEIFRPGKVKPEVRNREGVLAEEDIKVDVEARIKQARESKDWRKLLRYLYIKTLQLLNENKMITWSREKTNMDYLNELTQTTYHDRFKKLSLIFNRVWYGDLIVDEQLGKNTDKEFSDFFRMINDQRSR